MKKGQDTRGFERYIALDIHREYIVVGGWSEEKTWVLTPRRVSIEKFPEWAKKNIRIGDIVVLETTTNAWTIYDIVGPLASQVLVARTWLERVKIMLFDKKWMVEPRHKGKADGDGEVLPEEENNGLRQQRDQPSEQNLERQISFYPGFNVITGAFSWHLTTAVIGTGSWGETTYETGN